MLEQLSALRVPASARAQTSFQLLKVTDAILLHSTAFSVYAIFYQESIFNKDAKDAL